jgi:hypothetical protein
MDYNKVEDAVFVLTKYNIGYNIRYKTNRL